MRSEEEKQFRLWIEEAERYGLVFGVEYEPKKYQLTNRFFRFEPKELKTKVITVERHLFQAHGYTPDWEFCINHDRLYQVFIQTAEYHKIVVDIKGGWMDRGSGQEFSINQKLMYEKHKIYVNKVVPEKLFKKTWVPVACRFSPVQGKPVKKFLGCLSIEEYIRQGS